MYKAVRNVLAVALLVAAAVGTWYLRQPTAVDLIGVGEPGAPPGYLLRDAVLLETDETGRVMYRVFADRAEERPADGCLLLRGVLFRYEAEEQVPWRVRAMFAEACEDESALELAGEVELERAAEAPDGQPTIVRTDRLLLQPEQHLATAVGDVAISTGPNVLAAVGLKAFLKENRLELESNVRGRFQP